MSDFDWVTAFFACSPNKVFETLKTQIKRDVRKTQRTSLPTHAVFIYDHWRRRKPDRSD